MYCCIYTTIQRGGADVERWVDMHTCTDAYTHCAWDKHIGPHMGALVCAQLCKGSGAEVGSQVDMHTCTDTCTHPNQPFFWKNKRLLIVNYIKELPVYQVKCKLVQSWV